LDGVWKTNYTLVHDVWVTSQFQGYCELSGDDLHGDWPLILENEDNMRQKRETVHLIILGWCGLLQGESSVSMRKCVASANISYMNPGPKIM
jgi:hypothetical protein